MEFDKLFEETQRCALVDSKYKEKEVDFKNLFVAHDWRRYVPEELQKDWSLLTERERKIIFVMADQQASAEDWD